MYKLLYFSLIAFLFINLNTVQGKEIEKSDQVEVVNEISGVLTKVNIQGRGVRWKVGKVFLDTLDEASQKLENKEVTATGKMMNRVCHHCEMHRGKVGHIQQVFKVSKLVKAEKESTQK